MKLRVLHVTEDFSSENTGVTTVLNQMTGWLTNQCDWVGIYSTGKPDAPAPKGVHLFYDEGFRFPRSWRCPEELSERLREVIVQNDIQVVHLHGLWRGAPWVAQRVAESLKVPTVLSVHGQLEPWAWSGQGIAKKLKKSIYWSLMGSPRFRNVSVLHAITPLEAKSYGKYLPGKRVKTIPNAVTLERFVQANDQAASVPESLVFFLGRIHPIKGIDVLIEAFSRALSGTEWQLAIAGPEEVPAYANKLRYQIKTLGLEAQVKFVGPVYDQQKIEWLKRAWVLVAPSLTEVVGMVNLEASACQTPTVTTFATGLVDWCDGGGLLVNSDASSLQDALQAVASWSMEERLERGCRSRALIEKRYALEVVGHQWLDLYSELSE